MSMATVGLGGPPVAPVLPTPLLPALLPMSSCCTASSCSCFLLFLGLAKALELAALLKLNSRCGVGLAVMVATSQPARLPAGLERRLMSASRTHTTRNLQHKHRQQWRQQQAAATAAAGAAMAEVTRDVSV